MEHITDKQMLRKVSESYPDEFYDYSDGLDIKKTEILAWIKQAYECAKKMIHDGNLDEGHGSISSGNTIIFVEAYKQKNGEYSVHVSVSKNYRRKSFINVQLS